MAALAAAESVRRNSPVYELDHISLSAVWNQRALYALSCMDKRIVETPVQARQGYLDRPVLWVLVISIILAAGFLFFTGMVTL